MRLNKAFQNLIITSTILASAIPLSFAQEIDLTAETHKMRQQYPTSELGKFIKANPNDTRPLRMYVNQIHSVAMSLYGKIQLDLAKSLKGEEYAELYKEKEADYISLRFCIEHQKYYNDVALPARLRANTALTYAAAAKKCDSPPLQDFLNKQKNMTQVWRDFNDRVDRSIPIDAEKKALFQEAYISQFTAVAQQELAKYKTMPYSKPLGTGVFEAPKKFSTISGGKNQATESYGLPPLPAAPFKHDDAEMKSIGLHVKALVDRMNVNDKTGWVAEACRPLFESTSSLSDLKFWPTYDSI